jgi:hypothetical protein
VQILCGVDSKDTPHVCGWRGVNAGDAGMRLITAPKRDVQRARDDAIGCKRSLPGHQTRVLDAAGSDQATQRGKFPGQIPAD